MKRNNKYIFITFLILTSLFVSSCITETYFGESELNKILYFTLKGQVGNTTIKEDSLLIYVTVGEEAEITALQPDSVLLSTFARIEPSQYDVVDFTNPYEYTVIAENGSKAFYTVVVKKEGSEPQLENTNFDLWYTPNGKNYMQPGADGNSIWSSANDGVTILGDDNANTTPEQIAGLDYAAKLLTKDLGILSLGQRMGSATLFTGKFELNILDPPSSAKFGVAFSAKPKAFSIDAKYMAGSPYKSNTGKVLDKIDSADVYLLLENREDLDNVIRIATAWIRTGDIDEFINIKKDLIYGVLPSGTPSYQLPQNGLYGTIDDKVTHISVVFASSANGINYEGGVNSTLVVNNLVLHY